MIECKTIGFIQFFYICFGFTFPYIRCRLLYIDSINEDMNIITTAYVRGGDIKEEIDMPNKTHCFSLNWTPTSKYSVRNDLIVVFGSSLCFLVPVGALLYDLYWERYRAMSSFYTAINRKQTTTHLREQKKQKRNAKNNK